jgi:hypothetical protein
VEGEEIKSAELGTEVELAHVDDGAGTDDYCCVVTEDEEAPVPFFRTRA